jgi:hypothetical protein
MVAAAVDLVQRFSKKCDGETYRQWWRGFATNSTEVDGYADNHTKS